MEKCYVEVHHQPWMHEKPFEVLTFSCRSAKKNPGKKMNPTNLDTKMNQIVNGDCYSPHNCHGFDIMPRNVYLTFTCTFVLMLILGPLLSIQPLLGSDDHDNAHWGVFADFKQKFNKQYKSRAGKTLQQQPVSDYD